MAELMTADQVAAETGRPLATIRYWVATGTELGPLSRRIGRRRVWRRADIERWLADQFEGAAR
ncbi:hypothetical protein A5707_11335 [Mycobacterium kyorinense]|uniref:Helix-turn-helix domain-containing protein n=2 Tax=Mycobacterium kyorinense TaxID=487514 RepID=A0A1A2ZSC1_9MYCO|nr:hypothetical protein A5707_11335 [Mycobacterium kyorinense]